VVEFHAIPLHDNRHREGKTDMDDIHARSRQLAILTALAEGVHPTTGEVFAEDCPYHSPDIVRALYGAVRLLESGKSAPPPKKFDERPREAALANVGKPWSVDEDRQLLVEFDAGKSLKECAMLHQRTHAGIEARLEKLGRLKPEQRTTARRFPAPQRGSELEAGG
jgi:hypothetical protein